ncbi:MAG: agmatine/peptidylarginine deiminase [Gammaproteobacteria bacterium]
MRRLPAEWEKQDGIILTWPHQYNDWQSSLPLVEKVFAEIAYHAAHRQSVLINCWNESHANHIKEILHLKSTNLSNVQFTVTPSNDTWARDHGPVTILEDHSPILLDFQFNGWGGKHEFTLDNSITLNMQKAGIFGNSELNRIDFILEGGSIDSDGLGTLLTTRDCLLSDSRNSDLNKDQIETRLKFLLGIERFLWIENGYLAGDDTDNHIDMLARFCNSNTIAYSACSNNLDEHYFALKAMESELVNFRTTDNQPYQLVPLPIPAAIANAAGDRLPASYANFLIINNAVLLPHYNVPEDIIAHKNLESCFPEREIIGIDCRPLIEQYGSLHCVTMQLPAGILEPKD